jgi:DNA-binding NtrC family response regulator
MISKIVLLIRPETAERYAQAAGIFKNSADYLSEISELYTLLKERSVEIILIAEDFPGMNVGLIRRIRMRAPMTDIWRLNFSSTPRPELDERAFDGSINILEGKETATDKIQKILSQRELMRKFNLVGRSERMRAAAEIIEKIAPTDISVLIIGPSGSGKELTARAIHDNSRRAGGRFVAVNCGALAEGVLESELFGHEKGAFTGSVGKREGLFVQAHGGTIFLDEIGETKPDMQVKLLRVLEDGVFYPVGGDKPVRSDARVIAATNRDLTLAVQDGLFREDLYFRLGVIKINLPSLLERKEDILPLLYHFAAREGVRGFSESAIDILTRYDWPGNVRQLRNFVARIKALNPDAEISGKDAEQFIAEQGLSQKQLPVATGRTPEEAGHELIYRALLSLGNEIKMLRDLITANLPSHAEFEEASNEQSSPLADSGGSMKKMEKELIAATLREAGGNRKLAARKLGIGERTLYRKIKKYNLS